jgi:hypothetical protein
MMKFRLMQVYVFVMLTLLPAMALAAEEVVQQNWWQALVVWLITHVGELVFSVLGIVAMLLVKKYFNVKLEHEQLDRVLGYGKNYAEGKAFAALNAGQPKTPGAEKMKMGTDIVESLIEQFGLKKMARDKIEQLLEAKLGEEKVEEKKALLKAAVTNGGSPVSPKIVVPNWAMDGPADG